MPCTFLAGNGHKPGRTAQKPGTGVAPGIEVYGMVIGYGLQQLDAATIVILNLAIEAKDGRLSLPVSPVGHDCETGYSYHRTFGEWLVAVIECHVCQLDDDVLLQVLSDPASLPCIESGLLWRYTCPILTS